jgi:uncharacterized protein YegL
MSRRLPIYILIDTSGSMHGEPIQAVNVGLQAMLSALRRDPHAMDSVYLSVIAFDISVAELFPLTPLETVQIPEITTPRSGPTHLGDALSLVLERAGRDVRVTTRDRKGDWRPMLFIMTDGSPSDMARFEEMVPRVRHFPFAKVIACAAGPKARTDFLTRITDTVVRLDTTDSTAFAGFFKWVSDSVGMQSQSMGRGTSNTLPPPPAEIQIVI